MNRTKTALFILLLSLVLNAKIKKQHKSTPSRSLQRIRPRASLDTTNGSCDPALLQSFGLYGRENPRPTHLKLCPRVINSCCTRKDQVVLFNNWVNKNEANNLRAKFINYTNTIGEFFEVAKNVTIAAKQVIDYTDLLDPGECKSMARRVLSYQIDDVMEALLMEFKETFDFYRETFEGMACSLCDAHLQVFINSMTKKVIISEKFCRSIIANSLTSIRYFKVHLPIYINLLSTFASTCNEKGTFTPAQGSSPAVEFVDPTIEKQLDSCFKGRNTDNWLSSCQSICQKWGVGKSDTFYLPDWGLFNQTIYYLKNELLDWNIVWQTEELESRILSEKKTPKKLHHPTNDNSHTHENFQDRDLQVQTTNTTNTTNQSNTSQILRDSARLSLFAMNSAYLANLDRLEDQPLNLTSLPLNPNSPVVFVSQDNTSPSFAEYSVDVSNQGIDFLEVARYTEMDEETLLKLLGPLDVFKPVQFLSPNLTQPAAEPIATGLGQRKLKKQRKLKTASLVQTFVLVLLALLNKY